MKKNEDVVKILEDGKFTRLAYPDLPPSLRTSLIGEIQGPEIQNVGCE